MHRDPRVGIWHIKDAGQSLTMDFYAGRIIREAAMKNRTVDRNDLDDQLFRTLSRSQDLHRHRRRLP